MRMIVKYQDKSKSLPEVPFVLKGRGDKLLLVVKNKGNDLFELISLTGEKAGQVVSTNTKEGIEELIVVEEFSIVESELIIRY
ncbi:MAG: hypothetical protein H0Z24_05690 [Thermosipho sp. (in: Bacteria)]|nr:hypothetical protein [Thermosipho sp. (in: thermotogales)]